MQLHFLYGTETGTAELLCEDLVDAMQGEADCKTTSMEDVDPASLEAGTLYFMVTSTYGNGDLPSTAEVFSNKLKKANPDLSHVRFAVFGLGDTVFGDTFNLGSKQIMDQLLGLKANMVGEIGVFDASSDDLPEDIALPWAQQILAEFAKQAA